MATVDTILAASLFTRDISSNNSDLDGLIRRFLIVSRDLAHSRIAGSDPAVCEECQLAFIGDKQPHLETCHTGQVLDLLERICALQENPTPIGKEHAQNETRSRAKAATYSRKEAERETENEFYEPWYLYPAGEAYGQVINQSKIIVAAASGSVAERRRIAERIIACVNFCAGTPTSVLEDEKRLADLILNINCVLAVDHLLPGPAEVRQ
jgi:hypothetical protein